MNKEEMLAAFDICSGYPRYAPPRWLKLRADIEKLFEERDAAISQKTERFIRFAKEQAEWSRATFGSDTERGPVGPLKHLAKEVEECLAKPSDRMEYADLQSRPTSDDPVEHVRTVEERAQKAETLKTENARLRKALRDLVDAEWMMSHDWGGDRQLVLDEARAALTSPSEEQS
jgi:hypothetical protein